MITTYWCRTDKMTIKVSIDEHGKIVFAAPVAQRFLGQPFLNLERWLSRQEGFRKQIISTSEPKDSTMAYEQRDNCGQLFRNDRKESGDNQPNAKGKAMIGGVLYYISAWTKTIANGEHAGDKWQSLSFKPIQDAPQHGEQPDSQATQRGDDPAF